MATVGCLRANWCPPVGKKSQDAESELIAPMDSYTACRNSQGPSPRCRGYVDPPCCRWSLALTGAPSPYYW